MLRTTSSLESGSPSLQPTAHRPEHAPDEAGWPPFVCLACGKPLAADAGGGRLTCESGHAVPVRGGVPRFVPADNYAAAFGEQWKTFRRTQLDSYTGTTISRDRSYRCLGEGVLGRLRAAEPIHVLEVEC